MTDLRRLSTIATASGRLFCLADPRPEDVDIEDIATHLSRIARFTGAARGRYTVAQHSVFVSLFVAPEHAMHGLLHDAAEAYVGDTSAPMKRLARQMGCTFLDDLEHRVWLAIAARFELDPVMPDEVGIVDRRMCATEQRDLTATPDAWREPRPFHRDMCCPTPHDEARSYLNFIERFEVLSRRRP